jgi:hypothetical protein
MSPVFAKFGFGRYRRSIPESKGRKSTLLSIKLAQYLRLFSQNSRLYLNFIFRLTLSGFQVDPGSGIQGNGGRIEAGLGILEMQSAEIQGRVRGVIIPVESNPSTRAGVTAAVPVYNRILVNQTSETIQNN